MNQHQIFCRSRNKEGLGSTKPTWLLSSCLDNLQLEHQICIFPARLATAQSQAAPALSDIPVAMRTSGGVCDEPQNVFLLKPAGRGLRGRKQNPFLEIMRLEERWQLTHASLSVATGAVWGLGLHWRFVLILHRKHLSEGLEGVQRVVGLEKQTKSALYFNSSSFHS